MRYDTSIEIRECDSVYPQGEDSLLLLESLKVSRGERILEMGCGSGLVSLHCAAAGAIVTAADVNELAVQCTEQNAHRNSLIIRVVRSDLFDRVTGKFDQILFNPPYLPEQGRDPLSLSWSGGKGGLEILRRFLRQAPGFLLPGGSITVVVSSRMDEKSLSEVLAGFGIERLSEKRLFFEVLAALRLRQR